MILVTGSAGKTGRAVLQALLARGQRVRALVQRSEQIAELESLGVHDVLAGDLRDPEAVRRAFSGVEKVYHICPNVHPDELMIGRIAIDAALLAGVSNFVFHSVLHPQIHAMPHHWQKLLVEEQLISSGLPFTILQPAVYMQNILAQRESVFEMGLLPIPYPAETRLSFVDLEDVAVAAAIVLTDSGHEYATYPLVGTSGISQIDVAGILSHLASREVRVTVVPFDEWKLQARARGMGDYQVETLVRMFRYYAQHGLPGNPQVLSWLLGHPPTSLESFLNGAFSQLDLIDHRTIGKL